MTVSRFDDPTYRPRQREGLVSACLDGEVVLYDTSSRAMHHLNRTATLVWSQCDGERSVAAIARSLSGGADPEAILRDVLALVKELSAASLLVAEPSIGTRVDDV